MSSSNNMYSSSHSNLSKQSKNDIKEILAILKGFDKDIKDLRKEMNLIKMDMRSSTNKAANNGEIGKKIDALEKNVITKESLTQHTANIVESIQARVGEVAKGSSDVLESNVIQYIEYQVEKKINKKFENVNDELNDIKTETTALNSKIVSVARSIR